MNAVAAFYAQGGDFMPVVCFWLALAVVAGLIRMIKRQQRYGRLFIACCAAALAAGFIGLSENCIEIWAALSEAPVEMAIQLGLQGHAIAFNSLALASLGVAAISQLYFFASFVFPPREPA